MKAIEEEIYECLGNGDYDPKKFEKIKNRQSFCKPFGGLWSSPVDSEWGWRQWVECEMPSWKEIIDSSGFKFKMKPESKIYVIDSVVDLIRVPHKVRDFCLMSYFPNKQLIDFEKMSIEYDAILLTISGESDTRWSETEYGMDLYGWDCETLLVLRNENIEVV